MRAAYTAGLFALLISSVSAQRQSATPPAATPQIAGVETPWEARQIVAAVEQNDERLKPLLSKLNPQQWYDKKGAPSGYILQWQTAQQQLNDVVNTTRVLEQKIDSLPAALDVYFRMEALEVMARSLDEGAQRYWDRATADQLTQLIAQNFSSRERFRDYIQDLATSTEQNFKIADAEAQRCRVTLSQQPASKTKKK